MQNHIAVSGVGQMAVPDIIRTFPVQFDIAAQDLSTVSDLRIQEIRSGFVIPFAPGKDLDPASPRLGQHRAVRQGIPERLKRRFIHRFRIMKHKRIRFIFISHLLFPLRQFMLPTDNNEEYSP